jgi:exodeoxyribonuclease V alpha subunit
MRELSRVLAGVLGRVEPSVAGEIAAGVEALFAGLAEGFVSLDGATDPEAKRIIRSLKRAKKVVGGPGEYAPLVLDGERLYFARYWRYEKEVAEGLRRMAVPAAPTPSDLEQHLATVFLPGTAEEGQLAAVRGAVTRRLAIISGGPGTGKTTTVARILAVKALVQPAGGSLAVRLAAPTGKAADRLRESIVRAKRELPLSEEVKRLIPEEALTIHRLLGIGHGRSGPKRNRANPIPADVVVLDEASMIDLALMAKVVDALGEHASLILLGDKDQLDAVQPGRVFGDLCRAGEGSLNESLFVLTTSYRFDAARGIGSLARAVNAGDADEAVRILRSDRTGELEWVETESTGREDSLRTAVLEWLRPYFELVNRKETERGCFEAFSRSRLLAPLRSGPGDVAGMNLRIEQWLREEGLVPRGREWYPGRPLIITSNNYTLRLFNGDVGITMEDASGNLGAAFPGEGETWRRISPGRLPAFEPGYASTVHKSQGSEFESVLLLMPTAENPVINRNLLYTGITRAKKRCQIWGSEAAIRAAIERKAERGSGLGQRI